MFYFQQPPNGEEHQTFATCQPGRGVSVTSWISQSLRLPRPQPGLESPSSPGAFSLFIIVNLSATFGAATDGDVGMLGSWDGAMLGRSDARLETGNW